MKRILSTSTLALVLGISALAANAVVIDIGPEGQRVSGDLSFVGPSSGTNGTNVADQDIGGGLVVSLDNLNADGTAIGGLDWRDRGDSSSTDALALLGEDFVKNNLGILRLTLVGIPAGAYNATSYHMDPDFDQANPIQVWLSTDGGAFVNTGATGNGSLGGSGVDALSDALMNQTTASFQFSSDGVNPVALIFDSTTAVDDEVPLSGFSYSRVPEPSTGLLGIVGACLIFFRRRR